MRWRKQSVSWRGPLSMARSTRPGCATIRTSHPCAGTLASRPYSSSWRKREPRPAPEVRRRKSSGAVEGRVRDRRGELRSAARGRMFLSSVRGIQPAREEDDENKNRGDPPAEFHGARFWARTEFLPNEFLVIELGFRQAAAVVAPRLLSPARVVIRSASRTGHRTSRHVLTADGTFLRRWRRNWFSSGHGSQSLACSPMLARTTVAWSTISDSFGYQRFQDRPFSLPSASPDRLRNASRCFATAQERGAVLR